MSGELHALCRRYSTKPLLPHPASRPGRARRGPTRPWTAALGLLAVSLSLSAMSVTLTPSADSPAALGTIVTWGAIVADAQPGTLWYNFRVREAGHAFRVVRDYGPVSTLDWTTIHQEGDYEVEVLVRNVDSGEQASASSFFTFLSLAGRGVPVAVPTAHSLVFLYGAPACAAGSRMRVEFTAPEGFVQSTPWKACNGERSMNFYLAGLRPSTGYVARHTVESATDVAQGPDVPFTTPPVDVRPPATTLLTPLSSLAPEGILLQSDFTSRSYATDLAGNVVWYSPDDIDLITRPVSGGTFLGLREGSDRSPSGQVMREFDLAGITVAETNAARVNEMLAAMGMHPVTGFHHEAIKLRNGGYLLLASSERILTDAQGPGPVDVLGDTILVLNSNLQVVWAWDSFDHLDTSRGAVLGELCFNNSGLGCPPYSLAPTANDWLHGNALQLTPDGNILYSARHQNWLIKIDYQDGLGSGRVLWRLGKDGDFQIFSPDPSPWFSHQHSAYFESDNVTLALFDNGNERNLADHSAHSRGQVFVIDEANLTATVVLNADLGTFSPAVGSAQRLSNGNYHFDSGFILNPSGDGGGAAQSVEVDAAGSIVYGIQFDQLMYRSFRLRDLYTAP